MARAIYVDIRYLSALEKANSVQEWLDVWKLKLNWLSLWSTCSISPIDRAQKCVEDALVESDRIFPFVDKFPEWEELRNKARAKKEVMRDASKEAFKKCVVDRALALDDGISPAADIAAAVSRACRPFAWNQISVAASSYGVESVFEPSALSLEAQNALVGRLSDPSDFIELVLTIRADRRAKELQTTPPSPQQKQKKQTKKSES
jgi:hypothetical protein